MRVVLLNGPPRAGKDAIGRVLWGALPQCGTFKFAQPIIDFMWKQFGIRMEEVEKDQPHPALCLRTPREAAIRYSEGFCKPLFGQAYFGQKALEALKQAEVSYRCQVAVFTDSGFAVEADQLVRDFGTRNVLQVRVHRLGHTFQGDSRSYWDHPQIPHIDFENDSKSLADLHNKVHSDLLPVIK